MNQHVAAFSRRWVGLGLLSLAGCVEPYVPEVINAPTNFLVVDGFLNGNGITRIKLSRTTSLAATAAAPTEKNAKLFILDDAGARYALTEKTSGNYQSDSLVLTPSRKYQLRITTASSTTYESDLLPLKVTPPIDNLGWKLTDTQVQLSLSTHDPQQQSRYYRWSFVETWEFHSAFESLLEYDAKQDIIVPRTTPIYTCWRTERPSVIKQGSSAQLSQDALLDFPLLDLSSRAERFKTRYSVLVSQLAETPEEFAYYELLRKNTEAVGTVNDPLPTQLTGNVHRVDNPTEPVLGFVGAHTVQYKRLFINRQELSLPTDWLFENPYQGCNLGQEILGDYKPPLKVPQTVLFNNPGNIPTDFHGDDLTGRADGYYGASANCVDCRLRGTNVKPSFW
jgi:hypothetical protein